MAHDHDGSRPSHARTADGYLTAKIIQWLRGDLQLWESAMDAGEACLSVASRHAGRDELKLSEQEICLCLLAQSIKRIAHEARQDEEVGSLFFYLIGEASDNDWEAVAKDVLYALEH